GRLIKEDGTPDGAAFNIGSGSDIKFFPNTQLRYDASNKTFVAVWPQGSKVMLNTVSGRNAGAAAAVGPFNPSALAGPTVAIDTRDGQYCVSSLEQNNFIVTPFDAASGKAGTTAIISDSALENLGIVYNLSNGKYLASWIDTDQSAKAYSLDQCAAPAKGAQPLTLAADVKDGILTYSENGQVIGLLTQSDSSPIVNTISAFDGDGNPVGDGQQKLFGGGRASNDPQGLAVDTASNRFGAVSIQDTTSVQFAGNVGGGSAINANSTIKPQPPSAVPNNGLPTDIAQLIEAIFTWALAFIGLVIFVRFFWAGVIWFTAAGNAARTGRAIEIMKNTAIGALLLFSSYVILYTINPDLVKSSFTVSGLPAVGTGQTNNSNTPTGCFTPISKSKFSTLLQSYENTVLAKNPSLGKKSASDASAVQEFIGQIIDQGSGQQIRKPEACDGSGVIANSIMIGNSSGETGEICKVVSSGSGTINDLKTADCEFRADWAHAIQD
ncbi:MAG TPA: pilin, partial [Candidatus Paceibacterota bacterium]|nr:pilin [Candidatus Paceibacterota bacterium]